jgi:hypothetical protein
MVFVERRAVADLNGVVDHPGPGRKRAQVLAILAAERFEGPVGGEPGDVVERAAVLQSAGGLVVVAADHGERLERADAIDDAVGLRSVADEVAEDEDLVPAARGSRVEDAVERVGVRVDVGQDQVAQGRSLKWPVGKWSITTSEPLSHARTACGRCCQRRIESSVISVECLLPLTDH